MSIKVRLRLYAKDIDLIAIKQNPAIQFGDLFRTALSEFVAFGYCNKVNIPRLTKSVVYEKIQTDITIFDENVIKWLSNVPSGLRCTVVKIILRNAINNPDLTLFMDKERLEDMMKAERNIGKKSASKDNAGHYDKPTEIKSNPSTYKSAIEDVTENDNYATVPDVIASSDANEEYDYEGIDMFLDDLDIENY